MNEDQLKTGSIYLHGSEPVEYLGPGESAQWVAVKRNSGVHFMAWRIDLKPWNPDPKPKSFEDERESLAREVEGTEFFNCSRSQIAARIRALTPDPASTDYRAEWERECNDTDSLMQSFDLEPEQYRTEGGSLNVRKAHELLGVFRPAIVTYESPTGAVLEISTEEAGAQITNLSRVNLELIQQASVRVKHMVDRFLGWQLPIHFRPDAGISYKPSALGMPTGTNLFDGEQAKAMVRYMLEGLADSAPDPAAAVAGSAEPYAWEIEGALVKNRTAPEIWRKNGFKVKDLFEAPQPNPAAFDEATERKLFEAARGEIYEFAKEVDGSYEDVITQYALDTWLASAKVQRGAVPAVVAEPMSLRVCCGEYQTCVRPCTPRGQQQAHLALEEKVSEVRKELERVADRYADTLGRVCMPAEVLRSLAAKLGDSNG